MLTLVSTKMFRSQSGLDVTLPTPVSKSHIRIPCNYVCGVNTQGSDFATPPYKYVKFFNGKNLEKRAFVDRKKYNVGKGITGINYTKIT